VVLQLARTPAKESRNCETPLGAGPSQRARQDSNL
jgi:hypothetical protein